MISSSPPHRPVRPAQARRPGRRVPAQPGPPRHRRVRQRLRSGDHRRRRAARAPAPARRPGRLRRAPRRPAAVRRDRRPAQPVRRRPASRAVSARARTRSPRARPDRRRRRRRDPRARHLPRPAAAQRVGRRHARTSTCPSTPATTSRTSPSTTSTSRWAAACTRCTGRASRSTRCTTRPSTAPAPGWTVVARSADGTVEALEWPGHDVIAVQWHPELLPGAEHRSDLRLARRAGRRAGDDGELTPCAGPSRRATPGTCCGPSRTSRNACAGWGSTSTSTSPSMAAVANVFRVASARAQPPRAHGAGHGRSLVHRLHGDVGAVGVGRDGVARAGHRRRDHQGHADRRRRHARGSGTRAAPA